MKKERSRREEEMLPEYDFSGGIRGKYAARFEKDAVMVVLDPDVAGAFPDSKSFNRALRALRKSARQRAQKTARRRAAG